MLDVVSVCCSCLSCWISWQRTSSSPTWAWPCSPSRTTSLIPYSSSERSYPFLYEHMWNLPLNYNSGIFPVESLKGCGTAANFSLRSSHCFTVNHRGAGHDQLLASTFSLTFPEPPSLPRWQCFWAEPLTSTRSHFFLILDDATRSNRISSTWWCLRVSSIRAVLGSWAA